MKRSSSSIFKTRGFSADRTPGGVRLLWRLALSASLPVSLAMTLFMTLVMTLGLSGCGQLETEPTTTYQIPWPNAEGRYSLQKVEVQSMHKPNSLSGRLVSLYVDPHEDTGTLRAAKPVGRFVRTQEGVMIPADYVSLQATAIHAHFERLHQLDEQLGIVDRLKWPAVIGIESNVYDHRGVIHNNAVFERRLNALLFVPYLQSELPIAVNAGILAHEHFHRIFQALVMDRMPGDQHGHSALCSWGISAPEPPANSPTPTPTPLAESPDVESPTQELEPLVKSAPKPAPPPRLPFHGGPPQVEAKVYNRVLLRGLNEGFADFWGWLYSGDSGFVAKSLPLERDKRGLGKRIERLLSVREIKNLLWDGVKEATLSEEKQISISYSIGTRYARMLREVALEAAVGAETSEAAAEVKLEVAKALIASLDDLAEAAIVADEKGQFLSPYMIIKPLTLRLPTASEASCKVLERVAATEETEEGLGEKPVGCGKRGPRKGLGPGKSAQEVIHE